MAPHCPATAGTDQPGLADPAQAVGGGDLPLRAIRVRSRSSGAYLTRLKGRGMEFDEAAPLPGRRWIRNIDWRITARTGQPYSKLFREEKERVVTLWVDYRAPMYLPRRAALNRCWQARQHDDRLERAQTGRPAGRALLRAGHTWSCVRAMMFGPHALIALLAVTQENAAGKSAGTAA